MSEPMLPTHSDLSGQIVVDVPLRKYIHVHGIAETAGQIKAKVQVFRSVGNSSFSLFADAVLTPHYSQISATLAPIDIVQTFVFVIYRSTNGGAGWAPYQKERITRVNDPDGVFFGCADDTNQFETGVVIYIKDVPTVEGEGSSLPPSIMSRMKSHD